MANYIVFEPAGDPQSLAGTWMVGNRSCAAVRSRAENADETFSEMDFPGAYVLHGADGWLTFGCSERVSSDIALTTPDGEWDRATVFFARNDALFGYAELKAAAARLAEMCGNMGMCVTLATDDTSETLPRFKADAVSEFAEDAFGLWCRMSDSFADEVYEYGLRQKAEKQRAEAFEEMLANGEKATDSAGNELVAEIEGALVIRNGTRHKSTYDYSAIPDGTVFFLNRQVKGANISAVIVYSDGTFTVGKGSKVMLEPGTTFPGWVECRRHCTPNEDSKTMTLDTDMRFESVFKAMILCVGYPNNGFGYLFTADGTSMGELMGDSMSIASAAVMKAADEQVSSVPETPGGNANDDADKHEGDDDAIPVADIYENGRDTKSEADLSKIAAGETFTFNPKFCEADCTVRFNGETFVIQPGSVIEETSFGKIQKRNRNLDKCCERNADGKMVLVRKVSCASPYGVVTFCSGRMCDAFRLMVSEDGRKLRDIVGGGATGNRGKRVKTGAPKSAGIYAFDESKDIFAEGRLFDDGKVVLSPESMLSKTESGAYVVKYGHRAQLTDETVFDNPDDAASFVMGDIVTGAETFMYKDTEQHIGEFVRPMRKRRARRKGSAASNETKAM